MELKTTGHPLIDSALRIAFDYAGFDGSHHKQWCIDQMIIALCGGEDTESYVNFVDSYENPEENDDEFIDSDDEEEGSYTMGSIYEWDKGIEP